MFRLSVFLTAPRVVLPKIPSADCSAAPQDSVAGKFPALQIAMTQKMTADAVPTHKCLKKTIIRSGFEMDSGKNGFLKKGQLIMALQTKKLEARPRTRAGLCGARS